MSVLYILFYEVFCPDFLDLCRQMFLFKSELVSVCSLAVCPLHPTITSTYHHHYHHHRHSAAVTETSGITLRQNLGSPKTVQGGQSNKT